MHFIAGPTFKLPRVREWRTNMKPTIRRFAFLFCLLLASVSSLRAQSDSSVARLSGTLVDSSGAGVPGVRITAQLDASPNAAPLTTSSANDGSYSLDVAPGRYRPCFTRESFVPRIIILNFSGGDSRKLDLPLKLEPLAASVVVPAQAEPAWEQETSASVTVITRDEIEKRQAVSLTDVLIYTPGVSIDRTGPEGGFAGVFLNGGNSYQTKVLVDFVAGDDGRSEE